MSQMLKVFIDNNSNTILNVAAFVGNGGDKSIQITFHNINNMKWVHIKEKNISDLINNIKNKNTSDRLARKILSLLDDKSIDILIERLEGRLSGKYTATGDEIPEDELYYKVMNHITK